MDAEPRRTRLYTFPGGVLEVQAYPGDQPGVGVYLEYRQSCNSARAFGPGEAERLGSADIDAEGA
ncbi:hypothetical protein [Nocardia africana]